MKKLICLYLMAALMLTLAVPALAEDDRIISVAGNATISLAADTATMQIGVDTRKETVQEAQKENAQLMAAVMEAIKAAGVDEKDIITSQFNVYSSYEYETDALGRETRILYYQVTNTVNVTVHDLTLIGSVLDAAMEAGANTTYGITFSSTQANEAYQKALTRAVEDAMQKAQVIAAAAGVELSRIISISALQNTTSYSRDAYGASNYYIYNAKAADESTTITSGDVTVSAEVTLQYKFK